MGRNGIERTEILGYMKNRKKYLKAYPFLTFAQSNISHHLLNTTSTQLVKQLVATLTAALIYKINMDPLKPEVLSSLQS